MRTRWKLVVVLALVLALAIATWRLAPHTAPIKEGNTADFWWAACRVQVDPTMPRFSGGVYPPREGWCIYYWQGFHGQGLSKVPAGAVEATLPEALEALEAAPPASLPAHVKEGLRAWRQLDPAARDAVALLGAMREARHDALLETAPHQLATRLEWEEECNRRWEQARRYRWNVAGEFAFATALVFFAAWPWLRNAGRWRWAIHLGLLPVLLLLPYWLGYAYLTFTSAGPNAGPLYPWLISFFRRLPFTRLDATILRALPRALAPWSLSPGPMLSLSSQGAPGPCPTALLGLCLGALTFTVRTALGPDPGNTFLGRLFPALRRRTAPQTAPPQGA
jgi:hypothetical protein